MPEDNHLPVCLLEQLDGVRHASRSLLAGGDGARTLPSSWGQERSQTVRGIGHELRKRSLAAGIPLLAQFILEEIRNGVHQYLSQPRYLRMLICKCAPLEIAMRLTHRLLLQVFRFATPLELVRKVPPRPEEHEIRIGFNGQAPTVSIAIGRHRPCPLVPVFSAHPSLRRLFPGV